MLIDEHLEILRHAITTIARNWDENSTHRSAIWLTFAIKNFMNLCICCWWWLKEPSSCDINAISIDRERDELRWCIWKPIKLHSLDISGLENKGPHWCRIVIIINIAGVISPWNSRIQVFFIENIAVMNHSRNYRRHGINFYDE